METEIQTLEQQLEEMRATYQLNQEKLDYNYRVLVERDSENTNTIKQQKKKLTRMADILSTLKARYAREEKRFKTENQGTPLPHWCPRDGTAEKRRTASLRRFRPGHSRAHHTRCAWQT